VQPSVAEERLRDVVDHVRLLAADSDTQNAWLHPCGWTRQEPYVHEKDHEPCSPVGELVNWFEDMWPAWRSVVAPAVPPGGEAALDRLAARLEQLDDAGYVDDLSTLDGPDWTDVRRQAGQTLAVLTAE
jgi:hypothetical protein